ncbi:MAG: hypothetical protein HFF90_02815 [Oscillibacter sp.]|nr:hypothetical protein [Oscillibacter sp.]MCI9116987.1 hypothetical protein [Acutalibacter sp.]
MSLRQKLQIADGTALFGMVLALLGAEADLGTAVCIFGCAILFIGTFMIYRWKRCPSCKNFLGRDKPDFCPHCGSKIDYDAKPQKR